MGSRSTLHGIFTPKNIKKYAGTQPIVYRSSWEFTAMRFFDDHPSIVSWASESIKIYYRHPVTGRMSIYIPDFLIEYVDKDNKHHVELLEIKPAREHPDMQIKGKINERLMLTRAINAAKWMAAKAFCASRGIKFRVLTETQLFAQTTRKKK